MFKGFGLFISGLVLPSALLAGHHEEDKLKPAASGGQVIVAYEVPCVDPSAGIRLLKELIAYESEVAGVSYSSVSTVLGDQRVGAIDVHASAQAMEEAFAWQEQDQEWLEKQARALEVCEASISEIVTGIHTAQ